MATDFNETPGAARYKKPGGGGGSAGQLLKNPIFKLLAVLIVGGGAAFAGMQFLSKPSEQARSVLPVADAPTTAATTTEITPAYQQAVQQLDQQRAELARGRGESALPTPMQNPVAAPTVDSEVMAESATDPLRDFENIIANSRNTGAPSPVQPVQPMQPAVSPEAVQALTRTMRMQMDQLMGQWAPVNMQQVSGSQPPRTTENQGGYGSGSGAGTDDGRLIVQAGSVYYGQMLMEANSDVPGPIMAQVLTGPFAGGRAIGTFETYRNHLAIRFKTIAIRNQQFTVDILALDPDTTLGGVVTEVDPRYFSRVLMPAAAAFVKAYGETISEPTSTTSVSGSGGTSVTTNNQDKNSSRDAMYAGMGEAFDRVGTFVDEEAASIKRLVRVAVGTPIGLFFVSAVKENEGR